MEMKEAYQLKVLGEKLKAKGLDKAEEMAGEIYVELKAWLEEGAAKSTTPFDDMVVPFLENLDAIVMPQIDKIDGQVG